MQYVNLGATGLRVSRVCLGMMSYGAHDSRPWALELEQSEPIIRAAAQGGITFFDTADVYNDGGRERRRSVAQAHHGLDRRITAAARP
jgi:aryl-alcohol dehydrogenase-like predicted oxidoreductase